MTRVEEARAGVVRALGAESVQDLLARAADEVFT
jgi:hypothetical protein